MDVPLAADWMTALSRVIAPVSPVPLTDEALMLVGALIAGSIIAFAVMVRTVGMHPGLVLAFCVAAVFTTAESAVVAEPAPNATLSVNYAGFVLPLALSLAFLVVGRAPVVRTGLAVIVSTIVCHASSYAIPHEGVLLHYRWPAIVAGTMGALFAWGRWERAGPIAFVAGTSGVIIGADLLHLNELITSNGAHRIILGGAGVFDGIFIVALLAALVAAFWRAVFDQLVRVWDSLAVEGADEKPDAAASAGEGGAQGASDVRGTS